MKIRVQQAREQPQALRVLYDLYRTSLPRCKQELLSPSLPAPLMTTPGAICFEDDVPVAALLWQEHTQGIVMAEFYAESMKASAESVETLISEFLRLTASARARYFELWTAERAHVPLVLAAKGFESLQRELVALTRPIYCAARWNEFRFLSLRNFGVSESAVGVMAELLHEAYQETDDAAFYQEYGHLGMCRDYLSRVLNSPLCDARSCWLAWSPSTNKLAGIALCYIWPRVATLYLEQLAVHPSFRRKGLGRALLASVCSPLSDGSIRRVLLTISTRNKPAHQLCRSAEAASLHSETAFVLKTPAQDAKMPTLVDTIDGIRLPRANDTNLSDSRRKKPERQR